MRLVFVVSPLRPSGGRSQADHEKLAERLCLEVIDQGYAPFAPHLFYTRFLDDTVTEQRHAGILCGTSWLKAADEVWVYTQHGVSDGMHGEIALARFLQKPVVVPEGWGPALNQ